MRIRNAFQAVGALGTATAAWGLFEAQWVQHVRRDIAIPDLPRALDGLRIGHLSDLHMGSPSLNGRALAHAVDFVLDAGADLVAISGDVRSRVSGDAALRRELRRLRPPLGAYAVLGNHDYGEGEDPFAEGTPVRDLSDCGVVLLEDARAEIPHGGATVVVAGMSPQTFVRDRGADGHALAAGGGDVRILLCHYPDVFDRVRPGDFHLVLAGHLHGGQICVPWPTGKIRLAHLTRTYLEGIYARNGTSMHVSRGVGTTFVPFRLLARPEATVLTLRRVGAGAARTPSAGSAAATRLDA
jgi:uncharacterized protein